MTQQLHFQVYIQENGNHMFHRNLYRNVLAALFIMDKRWKQPDIHHLMNRRTHTVYPHMVYYSAVKINEVLLHAVTWMNFDKLISTKEEVTKCHTLYVSMCMRSPEWGNL